MGVPGEVSELQLALFSDAASNFVHPTVSVDFVETLETNPVGREFHFFSVCPP